MSLKELWKNLIAVFRKSFWGILGAWGAIIGWYMEKNTIRENEEVITYYNNYLNELQRELDNIAITGFQTVSMRWSYEHDSTQHIKKHLVANAYASEISSFIQTIRKGRRIALGLSDSITDKNPETGSLTSRNTERPSI